MPSKLLFGDLIKMLQQVKEPQDISFELIDELKGLTSVLMVNFFLAQDPHQDHLQALEDTRTHFNAYFDLLKKDIIDGEQ